MSDDLTRAIDRALTKRADDTGLPRMRTADQNNPLAPVAQRPARRTTRTYRDPVGQKAVGNVDSERKKGKP